MTSQEQFRQRIHQVKRIVLKVGSRLLVDQHNQPCPERINALVAEIAEFKNQGIQVILVSSGAIAAGMSVLGMHKRPKTLPDLQAAAATGQSRLMSMYESACREFGFHSAQLLLTSADVNDRKRHLNCLNCVNALLKRNVLPIVNENDCISVQEICFGENDHLASLVGVMTKSEMTVLLTSTDGMYHRNSSGVLGDRLSVIDEIDDHVKKMAEGTDGNELSTGGMASKLEAAEQVLACGDDMWIIEGTDFTNLSRLRAGEDIGTYFPATQQKMKSNKRWLTFFSEVKGKLVIDDGAVTALIENGKSLLPSGISFVEGQFLKGDVLDIVDAKGTVVARGSTNYSSNEALLVKGKQTDELETTLGKEFYNVVIHRDNMVILQAND